MKTLQGFYWISAVFLELAMIYAHYTGQLLLLCLSGFGFIGVLIIAEFNSLKDREDC
jgi:hypothetical protein